MTYRRYTTAMSSKALAALLCAGCFGLCATSEADAQDLAEMDRVMRQGAAATTACPRPERLRIEDGPVGANSTVEDLRLEQAADAVLASGECSCENWAPSWQLAIDRYQAEFSELSGDAWVAATREVQLRAYPKAREARKICRSQGVR